MATPLPGSKAAQLPATNDGALSMLDRTVLPTAGPLQCTTRVAKGCVPEIAEEQVTTPDRLETPSSFQDGWDEAADHVPVSSAFPLTGSLQCFCASLHYFV